VDKKTDVGFKIYTVLLYIVMAVLAVNVALNFVYNTPGNTIFAAVVFLMISGIALYVNRVLKQTIRERVLSNAVDLGNEYQQYMNQWEYPYALFSATLRLVWYNEAFRKI